MLIIFAVLLTAAVDDADATLTKNEGQVFTDRKGHYVTFANLAEAEVFYGNGKVFQQLRVDGFTSDRGDNSFKVYFVDPRYTTVGDTSFVRDSSGQVTVRCGKRTTTFEQTAPDKAAAMIAAASFKRTGQAYMAYALARDDSGNYYYVDHGRFDDTSSNFRVFIGPRGNTKPVKLKNIVHDSEGDIFATATGQLRLRLDKDSGEWVHGASHETLKLLPVEDNLPLIYSELGVYRNTRLGTPCDDL